MKLIIVGASGSGKDYALNTLRKNGLNCAVKYTTRPNRNFEENGIDYHFIKNDQFEKMIINNTMCVYQSFNINNDIWYYGFSSNSFQENDIFILTPKELLHLALDIRQNCIVLYLNIDKETRYNRLISRNDNNDDINRRILSDEKDFENFKEYDIQISNSNFHIQQIYMALNLIYNYK
jgi:guanylate kinase